MLSSRTRSTIVALVASLSFAAATVAPAVSRAQPDWPALGHAIHCESVAAGYTAYRKKAETAEQEGHYALAQYYWGEASNYLDQLNSERCPIPTAPTVAKAITTKTPAKIAPKA